MRMCLCVRASQESSVLDELAAASSQVQNARGVSNTYLCISKFINTCIMKCLVT